MKTKLLLLAVVLLAGCASTPKASIRRVAGWRLESCMRTRYNGPKPITQTVSCVRESVQYCRSQGVEDSCGVDYWYSSR